MWNHAKRRRRARRGVNAAPGRMNARRAQGRVQSTTSWETATPSARAMARSVSRRGLAVGSFSSRQMVCVVTPTRRANCSWLKPALVRSLRMAAPSLVRFFGALIKESVFTNQFGNAVKP